jgi:AcrR family transcriptional regulator
MNKDTYADVRAKIVQAAQERLWHYGFRKTTIEEIAADAGIGKGTIYLHFSSKEEIALEIMAQFKKQSLAEVRTLAVNYERPILTRIKEMLIQPILMSHGRCSQSPAALEMMTSIRPNIHAHLKPFLQQELEIIARVLEEGNSQGIFSIDDTIATAQTLKYMCAGFWPPFPCLTGEKDIRDAVSRIVDMAYCGFKAGSRDAE